MPSQILSLKRNLPRIVWIFLFIASASAIHSQSLADLAEKEKLHRMQITNARVITVEEAAKYITEPGAPDSVGDRPTDKDTTEKVDFDEPVDFLGRPESYWRKTMSEARQKVKELETEKNALILKQNRLESEFHREDNGFRRKEIQKEIQKMLYEQDQNRRNLDKAEDALKDLEKEARKSGALPGWIREPRRPPRPQ
jgi:hypothetical protein